MKSLNIHKNEKGAVLALSLVFMALFGIMSSTAYVTTSSGLHSGKNYRDLNPLKRKVRQWSIHDWIYFLR